MAFQSKLHVHSNMQNLFTSFLVLHHTNFSMSISIKISVEDIAKQKKWETTNRRESKRGMEEPTRYLLFITSPNSKPTFRVTYSISRLA